MYEVLGDRLETLCREGRSEAVFIAPFIKRGVFNRLLDALPSEVALLCVTRWRPEEVAVGVSDPDIWLDIQQRAGTTLRICPVLHAKYYRVDTFGLIGSANLTGAALGWSSTPNLEILHHVEGDLTEWKTFEEHIRVQSILCTDAIYQQVIATAALLKSEMPVQVLLTEEAQFQYHAESVKEDKTTYGSEETIDLSNWLPLTRQPADLYLAYSGQIERLTTASRNAALNDLILLQVPSGFSEPLFRRYIAVQLLQTPCVSNVDAFVTQPRRFGAVKEYLQTLPCSQVPDFDSGRAWQTLMRWLLYFLPECYDHSIPRHSEVFQRRR